MQNFKSIGEEMKKFKSQEILSCIRCNNSVIHKMKRMKIDIFWENDVHVE